MMKNSSYSIKGGRIEIGKSLKLYMENGERIKTKEPKKLLNFLGLEYLDIPYLHARLYKNRFYYLDYDGTISYSISIHELLEGI